MKLTNANLSMMLLVQKLSAIFWFFSALSNVASASSNERRSGESRTTFLSIDKRENYPTLTALPVVLVAACELFVDHNCNKNCSKKRFWWYLFSFSFSLRQVHWETHFNYLWKTIMLKNKFNYWNLVETSNRRSFLIFFLNLTPFVFLI